MTPDDLERMLGTLTLDAMAVNAAMAVVREDTRRMTGHMDHLAERINIMTNSLSAASGGITGLLALFRKLEASQETMDARLKTLELKAAGT